MTKLGLCITHSNSSIQIESGTGRIKEVGLSHKTYVTDHSVMLLPDGSTGVK